MFYSMLKDEVKAEAENKYKINLHNFRNVLRICIYFKVG